MEVEIIDEELVGQGLLELSGERIDLSELVL
jgi:hypothetical protein